MTDAVIVLILIVIMIFALNGAKKKLKGGCCGSGASSPKKVKPQNTDMASYSYKTTAHIDGMTCDHCKIRVENAFNSLPGCFAKVNLKKKCAEIYSNKELSEEEVLDIIKKSGYTLTAYSKS